MGEPSAFNAAGQFVGFNIEMAHMLARELGVALAFVPVPCGARMAEQVQTGYCDISVARRACGAASGWSMVYTRASTACAPHL